MQEHLTDPNHFRQPLDQNADRQEDESDLSGRHHPSANKNQFHPPDLPLISGLPGQ